MKLITDASGDTIQARLRAIIQGREVFSYITEADQVEVNDIGYLLAYIKKLEDEWPEDLQTREMPYDRA